MSSAREHPCPGVEFAVIAAVAANGVIGRSGTLPWHYPEDLAHFKRVTMGHTLLMGRVTYENLPGGLEGRRTVVLSHARNFSGEGVETARSVADAWRLSGAYDTQPFVCGGAQVYAQFMPFARRLYLTRIHAEYAGDAFFPEFDTDAWTLVQSHTSGELEFCEYVRAHG